VQLPALPGNETTGGLSTLVDGFAAAEALHAQDAEAFGILARTPVRFRFRDTDTELVRRPRSSSWMSVRVEAVNFQPALDYVRCCGRRSWRLISGPARLSIAAAFAALRDPLPARIG